MYLELGCLMQRSAVSSWGLATLTFFQCQLSANHAKVSGGALYSVGKAVLNILACWFFSNSAVQEGGAIHVKQAATMLVSSCWCKGNSVSDHGWPMGGGALYADQARLLDIVSCTFEANSASRGGALATWRVKRLQVLVSTFVENRAIQSGGAIKVEFWAEQTDSVNISSCIFIKNRQTSYSASTKHSLGGGALFFARTHAGSWSGLGKRMVPCPNGFNKYVDMGTNGDMCFIDTTDDLQNNASWACPVGCRRFSRPAFCRRNGVPCRAAQGMQVVISSCTFEDGESLAGGGAIGSVGPLRMQILSCSFNRNRARRNGGGAVRMMSGASLIIFSCVFAECTAYAGVSSLSWSL